MLAVMEKEKTKVRLALVVDEEVRDALRLESALSGKDMAELIEDLVRDHFTNAVEQIRGRRAAKDKRKKAD